MDSKKNNDFINPTLAQIMGDEDPFSWQENLEKVIFRDVENRETSRVLIGQERYFLKIHKSASWKSAFLFAKNLRWARDTLLHLANKNI